MDQYAGISRWYNAASWLYSLGAVPRCRSSVLKEISEDLRVCFVGVGHGEEAILTAKGGADVTVVDLSASMLERLQAATGDEKITIIHGDVCELNDEFDVVVAHFFLNVFPPEEMPNMLDNLMRLCAQNGKLVIGDFWEDHGASSIKRGLQRINWSTALFVFRFFVKMPRHAIYVYDALAETRGWKLKRERVFRVLGVPMYRSVVFARNENS